MFESIVSTIKENPLAAIGVASGAGSLIGAGTMYLVTRSRIKAMRELVANNATKAAEVPTPPAA